MKRGYLIGALMCALLSTTDVSAISCNQRMQHGPKGLAKGALALLCAAATAYMGSELNDTMGPLWTPSAYVHASKKRDAFVNTCFSGCAFLALAYVTWNLSVSSIESLTIFMHDDEMPPVSLESTSQQFGKNKE